MPSSFLPAPPPPCSPEPPPPADALRERAALRAFLVANAIPLTGGVLLSLITSLPGVHLYGQLTLGVAWALLQLGVFVGTAWRYENRAASAAPALDRAGR
ncbi:hypothetical protein [Streptomyces sp. NPDC053431]|uniref:hypothetical protein n=1 Tax=Streptomyces sp. NPDC053431 TaxID=3365703 RepID=UPI0037CEEB7B